MSQSTMSLTSIKGLNKFCPDENSICINYSRKEKEVFQILNNFEKLNEVYFYSVEDDLKISEFFEFLETLRDDNQLNEIIFQIL
jgi:hypothetical protein